jgi:integrase
MIQSYKDKKTGRLLWEVVERPRSSKDHSVRGYSRRRGLNSEAAAIRLQKAVLKEAMLDLAEKEGRGVLFGSLIEQWELANTKPGEFDRQIQRTTIVDHVNILRGYAIHLFKFPADEIKRADVKVVFDKMRNQGKSKSRQKSLKAAFNNVFEWAIENGKVGLDRSPAFGLKMQRTVEAEPEILNLNGIKQLLRIAKQQDHPWFPIWSMALLTGMRSGELYALTWSDIDLETKQITVSKSYNRRMKCIKSTKSGAWRTVPISSELERILSELRLQSGGADHVLPRLPHWKSGTSSQVLRQFCEGNGLPSIRFHTLRACFATQLIRDSVAPAVVMKICGWRDLKTMQRYVRLSGIETEGATDGLKILPEEQVMGRVTELFT